MGYLIGLILCILFWKVDRHLLWNRMVNKHLGKAIRNFKIEILLITAVMAAGYFVYILETYCIDAEVMNGAVIFVALDMSLARRADRDDKKKKKRKLYSTLALMSDGFICGIVGPLIYILLLGNMAGIIYAGIYYLTDKKEFRLARRLFDLLNIIPSLYGGVVLYFVYIVRNRTFRISFNGEYFRNLLTEPLLNIYILAAYIESVNFYYIVEKNKVNYIKGYGEYLYRIDSLCVADYMSVAYGYSILSFIIFMVIAK